MSKKTKLVIADRSASPASGLATALTEKSGPRLRTLCLMVLSVYGFGWGFINLVEGQLQYEFATPLQWGGPVAAIVASVLTYFATLKWAPRPDRIIKVGLTYEVIIAWCIPIGTYWGTFQHVPVRAISADLVGFSAVALWMVIFTLLVPAKPRQALVALTLSAAAAPVTMGYLIAIDDAPSLSVGTFIGTFVIQYVLVAIVALFAARRLYFLGRDVQQAQELGSYRLLKHIGEGGMGEVWRGEHRLLARPAAIKLIRVDAIGGDEMRRQSAIARFEREAQVTASLQSPHTVSLFDFGLSEDNRLYYVMELLEGVDLETMVKRFGALRWERVVYILLQAVQSLGEAHRRGLIHRDVKPANLFLCKRAFQHDFVKVLDFGLVKRQSNVDPIGATESNLTGVGTIAGTPAYLPPEIALGTPEPDGRADLYSLGCVAFWLLTGNRVFSGETAMSVISKHISQAPEAPSHRSDLAVPEALDRIVLSLLAKDPTDRPESAEVLGERLRRLSGEAPWTPKRAAEWWRNHRPEAA